MKSKILMLLCFWGFAAVSADVSSEIANAQSQLINLSFQIGGGKSAIGDVQMAILTFADKLTRYRFNVVGDKPKDTIETLSLKLDADFNAFQKAIAGSLTFDPTLKTQVSAIENAIAQAKHAATQGCR